MTVRMLFVEDQPVVRLGLASLLADTGVQIAATATSGAEALRKIEELELDLVLLDVRLDDGDGLTTLARLKAERPGLPVLIFSGHDNPTYVARAVALGAAGYVLKGTPKGDLLTAIERAASGESHWTREDLRRVTSALASPRNDANIPLTRREQEVLKLLVAGDTNKRIAESLDISYETVKEHVQNLLKKVGVTDRTQAAVWAVRNGLVN
ncbi:MAG: response regulator transcription factor [Pirellulaceae bacterium]|nr:response regulator transcription factor [Pirellulaceae bacterium]